MASDTKKEVVDVTFEETKKSPQEEMQAFAEKVNKRIGKLRNNLASLDLENESIGVQAMRGAFVKLIDITLGEGEED